MQQMEINNQFGFFVPRKPNSNQISKKTDFESVIPSQPKVQEYRDSGYFLDSISTILPNQSLTPEQIAKGKTKTTIEEINVLDSKYRISNFEEVKTFLSKNRFLIPLLEEIPNKIYEYYGNDQEISLELLYEPDFPLSSKLWVTVLTKKSAEDARSIMDKIDNDWWLENIDRANCKLNIGIDYV